MSISIPALFGAFFSFGSLATGLSLTPKRLSLQQLTETFLRFKKDLTSVSHAS